jgi:hypothetical protein
MMIKTQLKCWFNFVSDFYKFKYLSYSKSKRFLLTYKDIFPCLYDKTSQTEFDRHYVYHTSWAARVIHKIKPKVHIDISSSIYFSSIISAFTPVKFYDYRPVNLQLDNLSCESANIIDLPFKSGSIQSLSCMHVVEHIGLGRYGDPLDSDGDLKAISELKRVLSIGGDLLFVVPVGKPKIMFNAHRIYSYNQIIEYFFDLQLEEFVLIPDDSKNGGLVYNASHDFINSQNYGCGCFWFKKVISQSL